MESIEGRLKVKSIFTVSGRGLVIAGDIVEGTMKIGMYTQILKINDKEFRLRIDGVEFVDYISKNHAEVGLFFSVSITKEEMQSAIPYDKIIECRNL